jgi:hypothetical protein
MTKQQQAITEYLNKISKGIVTINPVQAKRIIEIATTVKLGTVIKYRYNELSKGYVEVKRIVLEVEQIMKVIERAKTIKNLEYFYKYICTDDAGNDLATIYIVNPNLFEKL